MRRTWALRPSIESTGGGSARGLGELGGGGQERRIPAGDPIGELIGVVVDPHRIRADRERPQEGGGRAKNRRQRDDVGRLSGQHPVQGGAQILGRGDRSRLGAGGFEAGQGSTVGAVSAVGAVGAVSICTEGAQVDDGGVAPGGGARLRVGLLAPGRRPYGPERLWWS